MNILNPILPQAMYEETVRLTPTLRNRQNIGLYHKVTIHSTRINKMVRNTVAHCRERASQKAYPKDRTTSMRFTRTPAHPQDNSQVEKMNSFLKDLLTIATSFQNQSWPGHLLSLQLIYNATVHRGTEFTPNFLFFSREVRLPNTTFYTYRVPDGYSTLEQHALNTKIRLRQAL